MFLLPHQLRHLLLLLKPRLEANTTKSDRRGDRDRRKVDIPATTLALARLRAERRLVLNHPEELLKLICDEYDKVELTHEFLGITEE